MSTFDIITRSSGEIQLDYNVAEPTIWTRGQTATYEFEFPIDTVFAEDYTVSGHETYENVEILSGVTVTVPSGATLETEAIINNGTLDNDGTVITGSGSLSDLSEFVEWAGKYTRQTMLNGVEKYRVQIPDTVGIDTLVVGVEPDADLEAKDVTGVWGLIDSVSNQRNQALTTNRYQIDVTVLAPIDDYTSVSDVESDLLI